MSTAAEGSLPGTGEEPRAPAWLLPAILLLGLGVRLWRLGSLPPAIFRDEAEKALNGWFLLNGGVDASGRPWPVFIEAFGVTTSAIYQYATIPFLAIGGLNEWTARLPAAVVGIATVLFTWLLCRRVWGWQVAAWAAGLLALSPWHVPLSRWAQQGVFLPLLFTIAAWAVAGATRQFRKRNDKLRIEESASREELKSGAFWKGEPLWLMLAAACMALAMYAYDPARLFAPLLALAALVCWWRFWVSRWKAVIAALVVFFVFVSPVIWLLLNQGDAAQARFRFLSVFQPGVAVGEGIAQFASNYISHFSASFLLIRGDEELRHSGGVGMLNVVEFVFALVGAVVAVRRRCRWGIFIIAWLLLAPVASSLTRVGVPHALRSQVALPAWQILAAVGIVAAGQWIARRRSVMSENPGTNSHATSRVWHQLMVLIAIGGALPFVLSYFGSYATRSAFNWQYGVKQSLQYLGNPHTKNSDVFFHNVVGAEYLVPVYQKMGRKSYQQMLSGQTRYRFLPFQQPGRPAPPVPSKPAAWVTPPGYQWPTGLMSIPITAPAGEEMPPVMLIYLNPALMEQVKEQSTQ